MRAHDGGDPRPRIIAHGTRSPTASQPRRRSVTKEYCRQIPPTVEWELFRARLITRNRIRARLIRNGAVK